jgi:hypothetical protein
VTAMNADVFEDVRVWPIAVIIDSKSGVTAWAGTENDDLVLALGQNPLLFRNLRRLTAFIVDDRASNLAALPGYQKFQALARSNPDLLSQPSASFQSGHLLNTLDIDWHHWTSAEMSDALDSLNMLWDMAVTVHDQETLSLMRGHGQIGTLMNSMTESDTGAPSGLTDLDQNVVKAIAASIVSRLAGYICVVPSEGNADE